MEVKLKLSNEEHKELVAYCNLNDLLISSVVKDSFTTGFNIERYGLLNASVPSEKLVEKEVIVEKRVEVPIEIIKEIPVEKIVEIIKEVPVEKVVLQEVIKEVPVETVVEKIVKVSDDTQVNELLLKIQQLENKPAEVVEVIKEIPVEKVVFQEKIIEKNVEGDCKQKLDSLQNTLFKLKQENSDKEKKIQELEKKVESLIKSDMNTGAVYFKGSNLDDKLYK